MIPLEVRRLNLQPEVMSGQRYVVELCAHRDTMVETATYAVESKARTMNI